MILEILGGNNFKVNGNVQVEYKTGKTVVYASDKISSLIINPDSITSIIVNLKG